MAENKKSFILYADYEEVFEALTDEQSGKLIKHLFRYVNDRNPVSEDPFVNVSFITIKQQLKRDLEKWQIEKVGKSHAGNLGNLKRWNKDLYDAVLSQSIGINEAMEVAKSRKPSHSDEVPSQTIAEIAVTVTATDTVTVNDILLEKETKDLDVIDERNVTQFQKSISGVKVFFFKKSLIDNGFSEILVNDWMQVRKSKRAVNTETSLNNFLLEVKKSLKPPNEILEICISRDWKGFKNSWLENEEKNKTDGNNNTTTKKPYKFSVERIISKHQQTQAGDLSGELSEDTECEIIE